MFDVRPCSDRDEYARAVGAIGQYFNPPLSEERLERLERMLPHERMHAASENGEIVGVQPTHRRRGVLRAMMDAQLRDVRERGEPIAALWASEETIYARFGYGIASWTGELRIPHEWDAFAQPLEPAGTTRFVTPEGAHELFPLVYERVRRERPGMPSRDEAWWEIRHLRVPDEEKDSPRRFVVLEADGEPQAYAIYRTHMSWEAGSSAARLEVLEAFGTTPRATAAIWRWLLDVDWMAAVEAELLPPDHPLFLLLATPRRIRYRMADGLWVRLVDVGAALAGRAYGDGGALVLEVRDAVCAWNDGRWRLEGGECSRTDEEPDLALDAGALGSAFLGAVSFAELRAALRVEELREGAVERADALFAWRPLPWCPEIF